MIIMDNGNVMVMGRGWRNALTNVVVASLYRCERKLTEDATGRHFGARLGLG